MMPRSKGVKVWVVWFWEGGRWKRCQYAHDTAREAMDAVRTSCYVHTTKPSQYRITSGTVMPPGVKP